MEHQHIIDVYYKQTENIYQKENEHLLQNFASQR